MTSNNNNSSLEIPINFFRDDGDKYQKCLLQKGDHDYESINFQQISRNIVEVEYICLDCGDLKYLYNYLEDSSYD